MARSNVIYGFYERVNEICFESGMTKEEIAQKMGFSKKSLYQSNGGWGALKLARFCAVTGADTNWLLGLSRERKCDGKDKNGDVI